MSEHQGNAWIPRWFIRIAVVYFFIGVLLGIYMSVTVNFIERPVHVHINLLGWVCMALYGLLYFHYDKVRESKLAVWHFWLTNISLPPQMIALSMMLHGNAAAGPVIGIFAVMTAVATLLLVINIFRNDH
ncbi:MAG: cytochrome-c oxidase [Gammaproteobacteria bacterium]|nr:cytochrome-c oxidase [Gammaproteobacteria bacterium]